MIYMGGLCRITRVATPLEVVCMVLVTPDGQAGKRTRVKRTRVSNGQVWDLGRTKWCSPGGKVGDKRRRGGAGQKHKKG